MIKRFFLTLAFLAGLLSPAFAAGTIPLSLTQRLDKVTAKPLNGGQLYFIQAGTTQTPQNAFQDSGLTIPWPNPMTLDAGGNIPQLFFADGQIKVRLTNSAGVVQLVADNILVIGASSGGGGGGSVDPTTVLQTGDVKFRYGTGVHTGFVRQNGRTIGSATSGATERANADCQALFEYLWNTDSTLVVSTGRGASANADWVANKTIALPDQRGRVLAGANDMGNTNAAILNPLATTKGDTITLGSLMGYGASRTLLAANLPPYTPSGTINEGTISFTTFFGGGTAASAAAPAGGGTVTVASNPVSYGTIGTPGVALTITQSGTTFTGNATSGTSTAFDTITPLMIITSYIKL